MSSLRDLGTPLNTFEDRDMTEVVYVFRQSWIGVHAMIKQHSYQDWLPTYIVLFIVLIPPLFTRIAQKC